jgi:diguanylate cyclase (GGDEF)-like protein
MPNADDSPPSNGDSSRRTKDLADETDERVEDERTLTDSDQTAADADQTVADLDQTSADADQALADSEQRQANVDQDASDQDQVAADRELTARPDGSQELRHAHEVSREERDAGTIARTTASFARSAIAAKRLEQAVRRDRDAEMRDLTAQARDLCAEALDRAAAEKAMRKEADVPLRDRDLLHSAGRYESLMGETGREVRARAAIDRAGAARDRERAAFDRANAAHDREMARRALERAHLDDLTGAYQRGIGLVALQHEIDRARNDEARLVLGFVDVEGLKLVNDRDGMAAGDALLGAVARAMRSNMHSYEPIVRLGGNEFVCALADVDIGAAHERFDEIRSNLDGSLNGGAISVGLAAFSREDSLDDLIARAETALVADRDGQP